ncbi:MAG: transaldolase family protein [archaeon]
MIFFADTASLPEIEYSFSRGVNDGITTNPKIMETTGDLAQGVEKACKDILSRYPSVPVSLETDLRGIDVKDITNVSPEAVRDVLLVQADTLSGFAPNVVVKIPICEGGLLATRELTKQGIKTNVTACMTPYQALEAANAGATYVSLFANRMLDCYILELAGHKVEEIGTADWKSVVKENKEKYNEQAWEKVLADIAYVAEKLDNTGSSLIVGSIRLPNDILRLVNAAPQVITIPTGIVKGLENILEIKSTLRSTSGLNHSEREGITHPMTQYTLEEFEVAADSYRNKK